MRRLILVLVVLLAACSAEPSDQSTSSSPGSSTSPRTPEEALARHLADIADGNPVPVVDERQIVLLAGAEGASTAEIADLFTSIGAGRVAANFWEGFASGLEVDGIDVGSLRIEDALRFTDVGLERASVQVWNQSRQGVRDWHLARVDGEWRLDLFATFGDVYAGPLRLLVRSLDPNDDGFAVVRDALVDQAASLELAPATPARLEVSSELASLP